MGGKGKEQGNLGMGELLSSMGRQIRKEGVWWIGSDGNYGKDRMKDELQNLEKWSRGEGWGWKKIASSNFSWIY